MSESKKIVIYTGENGVKNYLASFFKELGVDEKDIFSKVEEAFQSITDNPDKPNIFGITVNKIPAIEEPFDHE